MLLRLLSLLCLAVVASGQIEGPTDFNELLDQLLDVLRPKIIEEGLDQIPITNINYDWSVKMLFFPIYGNINCQNGKVRYLSTIKRTGKASGEIVDKGLSAEASVGLGIMQFLFQTCTLNIKSILSITESVSGDIGRNSLYLKAHVEGDEARIDKIWVNELSSIELTTGTNLWHKLESAILNGLIGKFHNDILTSVNNQLKQLEGKTFKITFFKNQNHKH